MRVGLYTVIAIKTVWPTLYTLHNRLGALPDSEFRNIPLQTSFNKHTIVCHIQTINILDVKTYKFKFKKNIENMTNFLKKLLNKNFDDYVHGIL